MTASLSATPDLSGLEALAREGQLDVRSVLLRVQTDLFLTAPSRPPDMVRAFEALATGLIPVSDIDSVAVAARKLAPHPDTPLPVLDALLARAPEIAEIVLLLMPGFDRALLEGVASDGELPFARAVAERADLDAELATRLVARDAPELDESVAGNANLLLTRPLAEALIGRARTRPALADLIVGRSDLTGVQRAPLFPFGTEVERAIILIELERLVALDGQQRLYRPAPEADVAALLDACVQRDRKAFAATLARLLDADAGPVARLADDPDPVMLAFALLAAGVPEDDAIRMFFRLDAAIAQSVECIFGLADLLRRVPRAVAERLVAAVLGLGAQQTRREGTHVPSMAPGGTPARPSPSAAPARPARDGDAANGSERMATG